MDWFAQMGLMTDATFFRGRASAERETAETATLINIRFRSLRAAERWDELAAKAERAKAGALLRSGH